MGLPGGAWKPCIGMNKDGKCRSTGLLGHLGHKKVFGTWYGQVPDRKPPKFQTDKGTKARKKWGKK